MWSEKIVVGEVEFFVVKAVFFRELFVDALAAVTDELFLS
jgi:hypothetical protein